MLSSRRRDLCSISVEFRSIKPRIPPSADLADGLVNMRDTRTWVTTPVKHARARIASAVSSSFRRLSPYEDAFNLPPATSSRSVAFIHAARRNAGQTTRRLCALRHRRPASSSRSISTRTRSRSRQLFGIVVTRSGRGRTNLGSRAPVMRWTSSAKSVLLCESDQGLGERSRGSTVGNYLRA